MSRKLADRQTQVIHYTARLAGPTSWTPGQQGRLAGTVGPRLACYTVAASPLWAGLYEESQPPTLAAGSGTRPVVVPVGPATLKRGSLRETA